ncbi:MAG: glycosyltransferase family 4 protein [bacterium]|nr:glycosyltransferase family 4 protein [bacterium]
MNNSSAQITVLYLLDHVDLGGGETSFLAFIDEWRRVVPTVRPVVVTRQTGPVTDALERMKIETLLVDWPLRLRRGALPCYSFAAARRIDEIIREVRPSLIHANHFFAMLYAGRPARSHGLPLIWTCHGWFEVDRPAKRWIARRFATHAACVSEAVRLEVARCLPQPGRTSTDYLGIAPFADETATATRAAIRAEFAVLENAPLIGVVGRFQPIKGHQHLLDALPAVRRRQPDLRVWLIGDALFGSTEEQAHKAMLERRVRDEGLADCVRFLGFRSDARRLIRALDALVIPSERESFSMVAVEGLEAGVPVIGPDGWGPREIIAAPSTGLLFRPADAADLSEKIIQVLCREGEAARFDPAAGPRRVGELFSVRSHVRRTLALYRRLAPGPFEPIPDPAPPTAESPASP